VGSVRKSVVLGLVEVWLKKIKNSVVFICLFEKYSLSLLYKKLIKNQEI